MFGRVAISRQFTRSFSTGKTHTIVKFNGDGVGPEIMAAAVRCLNATGVKFNWIENMNIGFGEFERTGKFIDEKHLKAFEEHKIIFKGPITIPPSKSDAYVEIRGRKFTSANQVLRKLYNLYANVRPATSLPGQLSNLTPFKNVNLVVFRENTEDIYTGEEKWVNADTVEGIKRITRQASTKIAKAAFEYCLTHNRGRVTAVHKANVSKQTDGLFLSCAREVSKQYPQIAFDDQLADSLLTKLVQTPQEYDVLLCPNLFGDLISDLAAGLIGSLGLLPSAQLGDQYAVFEPAHGSAPDIAGKGKANPLSMIRCGILLLQHLNEHQAAGKLHNAVEKVLAEGRFVTSDLGGNAPTGDMARAIVSHLEK